MAGESKFQNIRGILTISAAEPIWPHPANIYIVPDRTGFVLIDVGCGSASSIAHLQEGLHHWRLTIEKLHTVVLSHAHPDHMGAMGWILEQVNPRVIIHHHDVGPALDPEQLELTFDIPLAKSCWAASGDEDSYRNFALLEFFNDSSCPMNAAAEVEEIHHADTLQLGDFTFEVVHTPGHSPGHISLYDRKQRILLPGDLVGKSPAWYVPASGGVIGYLESLAKLENLDAAVLLPSHGPIIDGAACAIQKIKNKLLQRESVIKEALMKGAKTHLELNKTLLGHSHLHFFPGCGIIESHLIKMEEEGIIRREGHLVVMV